eukprot:855805-Amorphochlora_amoeboformis.AAC.2
MEYLPDFVPTGILTQSLLQLKIELNLTLPPIQVMFNTGLMLRQAITGMGIDNVTEIFLELLAFVTLSQASNTNEMLESMLSRQTYISDALKRLGSNVEGTNYTFKAYMHQK